MSKIPIHIGSFLAVVGLLVNIFCHFIFVATVSILDANPQSSCGSGSKLPLFIWMRADPAAEAWE